MKEKMEKLYDDILYIDDLAEILNKYLSSCVFENEVPYEFEVLTKIILEKLNLVTDDIDELANIKCINCCNM